MPNRWEMRKGRLTKLIDIERTASGKNARDPPLKASVKGRVKLRIFSTSSNRDLVAIFLSDRFRQPDNLKRPQLTSKISKRGVRFTALRPRLAAGLPLSVQSLI